MLTVFFATLGALEMGECMHSLPTENWFCIRLQFCTLRYQNWLGDWGKRLNFLPTENWFCIRLQFCTLRYQNWLADWGKHLNSLPTENWSYIHRQFCLRVLRCKTRGLCYRREVLLTVGLFELKLT